MIAFGLAHPWAVLGVVLAAYAAACQWLRFRHETQMLQRFFAGVDATDPAARARRLAQMTTTEAQEIVLALQQREFPYMYRTALQFGIFKTYGVPAISRLLVATQSLTEPNAAAKRYQDTTAMFVEMAQNAPTSPRCLAALARVNYLHSRYVASGQIRQQDLLYTLAECVAEPARFIERFEWRPYNDVERCAVGVFWMTVGQAMQIDFGPLKRQTWPDGLAFADDITAWGRWYDLHGDGLTPDPISVAPSRRLIAMLLCHVPAFAVPFVEQMVAVLMGGRMRDAFALPEPGIVAYAVTYTALIVRRFVVRHLMLPRTRFNLDRVVDETADPATGRVRMHVYLTQPWYVRPSWWNRWGPVALAVRLSGGTVPGDARAEAGSKSKARAEKQHSDALGSSYMGDGFTIGDIGPASAMGRGLDEVAAEIERLRRVQTAGCPFA